ncbi:hypothetical protein PGIGA_G00009390 [Pangasianodon gigas]|uniref:Uncharacterized protein n=1 Tax=Pangasianodon gigas TaxID=30993 RepID=A0ACC5W792_PANGG|nr:hypothetical protein [Pangasianodon gigas]
MQKSVLAHRIRSLLRRSLLSPSEFCSNEGGASVALRLVRLISLLRVDWLHCTSIIHKKEREISIEPVQTLKTKPRADISLLYQLKRED